MFYLMDLYKDTSMSFETRIDLLTYWRFRLVPEHRFYAAKPLDFSNLNVTGNDMYSRPFVDTWKRRFQVRDEQGRSVDIRTWKKEIDIVNAMEHFPWRRSTKPIPRFRREPAVMGCKMPDRKGRYNAFTKQKLRDKWGTVEPDFEDDLLGFTPVKDHSAPRVKERHPHKPNLDIQSWKSSTKNAFQWGRHLDRVSELPIRKHFPADFDEGERMLEFERSELQELFLEAQMEEDMVY